MSKTIREQLIVTLASGEFVSGQQIADQLSVSRAAIANNVSVLEEMGLDIFKVRGKGYQLAQPLTLLNAEAISGYLTQLGLNNLVEVHTVIDSTNDYLMRRLPNQNSQGQVCVAEYQSAGRGRRGRQWISPFGSHLYLSYYHLLSQGMAAAMGLSLVTALAVSDAISKVFDLEVQLKWPNDVYLDGVKLAGILIDLEGQAAGECHCVIGIGLNLKMPKDAADCIDQPWTDLQQHIDQEINRNHLSAAIIQALNNRLTMMEKDGLAAMLEQWHQRDFFLGKPVKLITGENETLGICRGVNEQGAMLLEMEGGIKPVYGGEVSVRAQ